MHYFGGFSLRGEAPFFHDYIEEDDFTVAGFSYGAQRAFEYALGCEDRIERVILLSPAFFQNRAPGFSRLQLQAFRRDKASYLSRFMRNVAYPTSIDLSNYLDGGTEEELEALLNYRWERAKISALLERGTDIEVFLGDRDRIIESEAAFAFFSSLTTSYLVKGAGHLLQCHRA